MRTLLNAPWIPTPGPTGLLAASLLLLACSAATEPRRSASHPTPATPAPPEPDDRFERAADCKAPSLEPTAPRDGERCPRDCTREGRDAEGCCPDARDAAAFARACRACDPWACLALGSIEARELEAEGDEGRSRSSRTRARSLLDRGCTQGNTRACLDASRLHEEDGAHDVAYRQRERACAKGSQHACARLARDLLFRDERADLERAEGWLAAACTSGLGDACTHLGRVYDGDARRDNANFTTAGVPVDDARAAELYRTACELGDGDGCMAHATVLEAGRGVAPNVAQARQVERRAVERWLWQCDRGDGHACLYASNAYEFGTVVPRSRDRAGELREQACRAGMKVVCGVPVPP